MNFRLATKDEFQAAVDKRTDSRFMKPNPYISYMLYFFDKKPQALEIIHYDQSFAVIATDHYVLGE